MDGKDMQAQIDDINRKLDVILEEIEVQRRYRQDMQDLKSDLMRVGNDLFQKAVVELDGMHDQLRTVDVLHLGKKLLRNVDTLLAVVEQLESLKDFLEDASPLARESFITFMNRLDEFDRKGYFRFMKELGKVADNVVTSFTAEDVKNLGDNIVTILNTVKNVTQPTMLNAANNALNVYRELDMRVEEDVTLLALLREMNTPEARRGLAFAIRFLKNTVSHGGTHHTKA